MANQRPLNELALFAGAGGGLLGGKLLGWNTVCAVEWMPYPASVLCARQNDGLLPTFPIWDDVQTFDGKPWRGIVDVVSGGFPCQDISAAGKGAGIDGARSGMWKQMARIIHEVRPGFVFVENSPMLTSRGLGTVLGDLAAMGFDARWGVLGAADVGANHQRDRIWIVGTLADPKKLLGNGCNDNARISLEREPQSKFGNNCGPEVMANANSAQRQGNKCAQRIKAQHAITGGASWWATEPNVGRVANGVAARLDRLKATGNGQVSSVAATAWQILSQ
jgi:DNA (cytosine-5)-methyltransferase 1